MKADTTERHPMNSAGTVRALTLTSFGGVDALALATVPEPVPGEGEAVVHVRAVALGPWDLQAAEGYFVALGGTTDFPQTQGWDFAGETADGRRVIGFVPQPWMRVGALAETISLPAGMLTELPADMDWVHGAALPVSALTAQLLVEQAAVSEGETVLVTGAAGMVGGLATQLAKARGARVVAAVRAEDAAEARRLGADATVETGDSLEAEVRRHAPDGVASCLDTIGSKSALACVRERGAFVTTQPVAPPSPERGIDPRVVQVQPDGAALGLLAARAARGELTVRVGATVPLQEFRRGYELMRKRGLRGKVVVVLP